MITATSGFSGDCGIYSCCAEDTTKFIGNTITGDFEYGIYVEDAGCCGPEPAILYVEGNTIEGCDYGLYFYNLAYGMPVMVYIRGNTITETGCGIYVESFDYASESTVVVTNNNIFGNGFGFNNGSGEDIVANGNWWGDPSGPSGEGPGTGDAISEYVIVESFLSGLYAPKKSGCAAGAGGAAGMAAMLPLALLLIRKRRTASDL